MDFRLAVLASGRGSNLQALLGAIETGQLPARIVGVFSDKPACGAIAIAREHGLHTVALKPRDYADRAAHDEALFSAVADVQPDLIVCAGYLRIISEKTVRRFEDRMINLHPSLLPRHPGLDTHARVLAAGDTEHGASVHAVIPALDAGPVLAQVRLDVGRDDTPDSLADRLSPREHALLVASTAAIAGGRARLAGGRWVFDGQSLERPLQLDADNQLRPEPAHA
ncbi:phosphoribosylglycinamide formyltransferase [Arenimonas sp.]|uniref:phosphoribosylglycinamide formyltransferase n=1 Tax=Arenimonas sp. TaxID=1872635 RepID=UPI0035B4E291